MSAQILVLLYGHCLLRSNFLEVNLDILRDTLRLST